MFLFILATTAPAARAETERLSLGVRLALEGRCTAAIPELEQELATEATRVESAWRLGQCALRLKDYARSALALETTLELDPARTEVWLDLARARYHAKDAQGADAALISGQDLADRALWQLYRGLVDLELGRAEAAVDALQRAVDIHAEGWRTEAEAEPVEPMASYYLGIALGRAGERERSLQTLRGVAEGWAGTDWGSEASQAMRESAQRRAFITLGVGGEYDDNVVLLGRGATLPDDISNEQGGRALWLGRGGVDIGTWGRTSAGLLGSYRGRAHFDGDLDDFDSHFPAATLWVNHALLSRTHLRLTYDFGHAWVNSDPFLITNAGQVALLHAWSQRQTTALYARVRSDEYQFRASDDPSTGANESRQRNRDGWGGGAGFAHALTLPLGLPWLTDPALRVGYFFTRFDAEGIEYSNDSHRLFSGLSFVLPFGSSLDLEGGYEYRLYDHPSTFVSAGKAPKGGRRREHVGNVGTRVTVPVAGPVSVSMHHRFRVSDSTSGVFDYAQHVVGGTVNVTFARKR